MKKTLICIALMALASNAMAELRTWKLTSVPAADAANMTADANWKVDSKNRHCYTLALNNEPAMANGASVSMVEGLKFTITASSDGNLRFGGDTGSMWLGTSSFVITGCHAGEVVKIEYMTSKSSATRSLGTENLEGTLPSTSGKTHVTGTAKVVADGDVKIIVTDGIYFYGIEVGSEEEIDAGGSGGGSGEGNPDNPTDNVRGLVYTDAESIATPAAGTDQVLWCSPDGNNTTGDGSEEKPFYSLQYAVDKALPGTTIYMKGGTYNYDARVNINDRNGTHDKYITVMCPDGRAILDFSSMPYHAHSDNPQQGIRLTSSYWHFYKIDICNASDNGMLIERNKPTGGSSSDIINRTQDAHDNIIEFCNFYKNGDTGLQMKNLATTSMAVVLGSTPTTATTYSSRRTATSPTTRPSSSRTVSLHATVRWLTAALHRVTPTVSRWVLTRVV